MELVVDTSALIAVLTSEPQRKALVERTRGADLIAPASVHWEIGNALAAMLKRNRITLRQALEVLIVYRQISIRFVEVDLDTSLEIAARHRIYAYDAYVLACAQRQGCELLALDKGLIQAACSAGIRVIEVKL
ncbi:MAG: type II toxin-antitoxin system VapC family toxin [Candidatus Sumerlaeota bacterium]|nr:type II toxin-antitoxin system VapC family toxin [Candidatus Sumerlaeota bacterium]